MNDLSGIKAINNWSASKECKNLLTKVKTEKKLQQFDKDAKAAAEKELSKGR